MVSTQHTLERLRRRLPDRGRLRDGLTQPRTMIPIGLSLLLGMVIGTFLLWAESLPLRYIALVLAAAAVVTVALVTGEVRRLILTAVLLDIPFSIDTNLFYNTGLASFGAIGGLSISITLVGLLMLYALWLADWLVGQRYRAAPVTRPWVSWSVWPLAYIALVWVSMIMAENVLLATFEVVLLTQMLLLFIYVVAHTQTRQDVYFILIVLVAGLLIEGVLIVMVMGLGRSIDLFVTNVDYDRGRAGGTMGSPIIAAGYLYLLLAPTLTLLIARINRRLNWLAAAAFVLGSMALILTFSRAGWFAFFFSCGTVAFFCIRRGWLPSWVTFLWVGAVTILIILYQDAILTRLLSDDGGSAAARVPLMKMAWSMIQANPLGVGANNYAIHLHDFALADRAGVWLYTVHNKYLLIWAETGLLSLLAFVGFLLITLKRGWRAWLQKDRIFSPLALGLAVAIIGNMIHMMVDIFHSREVVALLWLNAALITSISCILHEEKERETGRILEKTA